jgi:DNA-binding NarL/FixJ family response regulator
MNALRSGLATLEQMAREMLYELRSIDDDEPLPELSGVTLSEALSRLVEETAETLHLSSRIIFSGEERTLASPIEGLLYRIAREALYQVQQHTGTRRLRFAFNYGREEVQMTIEDDGVAPTPNELIPLSDEVTPPLPSLPSATNADAQFPDSDGFTSILHVLRHRLEHLGGSLTVTTSIEHGTTTQARIPYQAPVSTETATLPAPNIQEPLTGRIRVLVVDSQAVTRAGLRRLLETYPDLDIIGEASDGVQAVSETVELGPQVVLMDTQLPNGQSMEALRQIKQLNPDTKVLLLSTMDREEYLYETLRAGADGFVLKDIAPDELAQAIRTVARGEVMVQSQLASRLLSRFGKQSSTPGEALTAREQEVLQLLARGLRNKEIASRLYVSERTVNFHLANIYQKLNVSGRTEALSKALEQGLIRT